MVVEEPSVCALAPKGLLPAVQQRERPFNPAFATVLGHIRTRTRHQRAADVVVKPSLVAELNYSCLDNAGETEDIQLGN